MNWKTIVVAGVIGLLVAALALVVHETKKDKSLEDAKQRIKTYRVVAEEQHLIRSILEDKIWVAQTQAKLQPKPIDPNKAK